MKCTCPTSAAQKVCTGKEIKVMVGKEHRYTINHKCNGVYELRYSDDKDWNYPNKLVMTMYDSGNGVTFVLEDLQIKTHLNREFAMTYDCVEEMTCLIDYVDGLRQKFHYVS
jgi:hypothetical protein